MEFDEEIRSQYPQLAFLLDDPEMGPILRESYQARKEGRPWTDAMFQAEVMKTNWYRTHSATARQVLALHATDPATYQRQFDQTYNTVQRIAGTLGVGVSSDRVWQISTKALAENLTEFEIRRLLIEGDWHVTAGDTESQVRRAYAEYFMPMSDEALREATARIVEGTWTIDGLRAVLAEQTVAMYPHMSRAIESGMSPAQWFAPYQQQIAQLLEINPNTIDPTRDQRWRPVFDQVDADGNHRSMTLYETAEYVRKLPEWRQTRQARDQAAQLGEVLLQTFGKVA